MPKQIKHDREAQIFNPSPTESHDSGWGHVKTAGTWWLFWLTFKDLVCSYSKLYQVDSFQTNSIQAQFSGGCIYLILPQRFSFMLCNPLPDRDLFLFIFQRAVLFTGLYLPCHCSPCPAITVSGHPFWTDVINEAFHTQVTSMQLPKKTQLQRRCKALLSWKGGWCTSRSPCISLTQHKARLGHKT